MTDPKSIRPNPSDKIIKQITEVVDTATSLLSQELEDTQRDMSLGFAEVHGKIDYLRAEINEVKQILNSLFR